MHWRTLLRAHGPPFAASSRTAWLSPRPYIPYSTVSPPLYPARHGIPPASRLSVTSYAAAAHRSCGLALCAPFPPVLPSPMGPPRRPSILAPLPRRQPTGRPSMRRARRRRVCGRRACARPRRATAGRRRRERRSGMVRLPSASPMLRSAGADGPTHARAPPGPPTARPCHPYGTRSHNPTVRRLGLQMGSPGGRGSGCW